MIRIGYILIRTYGNSFGDHNDDVGQGWFYNDEGDFNKAEENRSVGGSTPFLASYYSHAICFHREKLSSYSNEDLTGYYRIGYDECENDYVFEDVDVNNPDETLSGLSVNSNKYVAYKNIDGANLVERDWVHLDGENFKLYRNAYAWAERGEQTVTISDWLIKKDWINKNRELFEPDKVGEIEHFAYFSLYTLTAGKNSKDQYGYEYGSDIYNDFPQDAPHWRHKLYWNMRTAYDAYNIISGYYWDSANLGVNSQVGQSIFNLFDNVVVLPEEEAEPQEVYVRHIDEDGNLINIANPSEVLIQSGKESILANQKNSETPSRYQEYYSFNLGEKLRVSRSLTLASNGKVYKYKAYKTTEAIGGLNRAEQLDNSSMIHEENNIPSTIEVGGSSTEKTTTIVTFIYSEEDVPGYPTPEPPTPPPGPKGDIHTEFSSDTDSEECIQKYTPTDRDITPYLKANKMLLKDLKYKLVQEGNQVKYYMEVYNIQQLVGGKMTNDSSSDTGYIYGDEPYALLRKEDESRNLVLKDSGIPQVALELSQHFSRKLISQSQLDSFIRNQLKTSYSDFNIDENRRHIPKEKYNGIRTPKLYATYEATDVLRGVRIARWFRRY